jgi:hypothetical protein
MTMILDEERKNLSAPLKGARLKIKKGLDSSSTLK